MTSDLSRQLRDLEEIAAFLRGEVRRAEFDRIRIPNELADKIAMLRRTSEAIENDIRRMEALRRPAVPGQQRNSWSTLSFPFSHGSRPSNGSGGTRRGNGNPRTWRP